MRFDPSIPEHEKFVVKDSDIENDEDKYKKNKNSKNKQKIEENEVELNEDDPRNDTNEVSVSKETYYEVADELKERFKSNQKSSFSFSALFNTSSGNFFKRNYSLLNFAKSFPIVIY